MRIRYNCSICGIFVIELDVMVRVDTISLEELVKRCKCYDCRMKELFKNAG